MIILQILNKTISVTHDCSKRDFALKSFITACAVATSYKLLYNGKRQILTVNKYSQTSQ